MLRPRSRPVALSLAALGVAVMAWGCSVSPPGAAEPTADTAVHSPGGPDASDAAAMATQTDDAGVAGLVSGSPLCAGSDGDGGSLVRTCDPDSPTPAGMCSTLAPDGGLYNPSGGYADASLACRVVPSASIATGGIGGSPTCALPGPGTDGASCEGGSDCAAGFDCVGPGVCRHYCCAGNGPCAGSQFCDIQPLAHATTTQVPVCVPIEPPGGCGLLAAASCPSGETCAVVREDGATSCVENGSAKAGDSCETQHCAAGLVCLGTAGLRMCFTLCHTSSATCVAPDTCQGGLPLFQDPTIGVCR